MGRQSADGQKNRPVLILTQRRHQRPGGAATARPRFSSGKGSPGRLEGMGESRLPYGAQINAGVSNSIHLAGDAIVLVILREP